MKARHGLHGLHNENRHLRYMGCVFANEFSEFDGFAHTKEFQVTLEELKRLSLSSEDVRKLYAVFNFTLAADDDRTAITLTTLLLRLGIPYTAFAHEVFTIFSPGRLDFRALALTVWNYCTLTIENMHLFVFDLYNTHCRALTPTEVSNIFKDIHGDEQWKANRHTHNATVELKSLEAGGATFTIDSFNEFMFTRMALLVPAMHFQRLLQMRFCGRAFWKEQTKNRKRLHPEHNYVSIAHLLNPDLMGLSSSGDALTSPVTSPNSVKKKKLSVKDGATNKKLHVQVHPENSNDTEVLDMSATPPALLTARPSVRRKQSRHSLKFFNDRHSQLHGLSSGALPVGASAISGVGEIATASPDLLNSSLMDNNTTTTDERTHRKTIRPTSAAQTPSKLRSRQRHTQLNESMH